MGTLTLSVLLLLPEKLQLEHTNLFLAVSVYRAHFISKKLQAASKSFLELDGIQNVMSHKEYLTLNENIQQLLFNSVQLINTDTLEITLH